MTSILHRVEWLQVLTPILVLALAGLGYLYKAEREKREAVERQLSDKKYETYVALMGVFFGMLTRTLSGRSTEPGTEVVAKMIDIHKDLMIYGADEVLTTYESWMTETRRSQTPQKALRGFGEVVVAIRRDMGQRETKVTSDHVLRLLITDYDDAVEKGFV